MRKHLNGTKPSGLTPEQEIDWLAAQGFRASDRLQILRRKALEIADAEESREMDRHYARMDAIRAKHKAATAKVDALKDGLETSDYNQLSATARALIQRRRQEAYEQAMIAEGWMS